MSEENNPKPPAKPDQKSEVTGRSPAELSVELLKIVADLIKYPVLAAVVLWAVIELQARHIALDFKSGESEIHVAEESVDRTNQVDVSSSLKILQDQITELRAAVPQKPSKVAQQAKEVDPQSTEADNQISDQQFSGADPLIVNGIASGQKTGWIYLGSSDSKDKSATFKVVKFQSLQGGPVNVDNAKATATVAVTGNMVLRQDKPQDSPIYFRAIPAIGLLPVGTKVQLLEDAVPYQRATAVQWWAHVKPLT